MRTDEDDKDQLKLSPYIADIFAIGFIFTKLILHVLPFQKRVNSVTALFR